MEKIVPRRLMPYFLLALLSALSLAVYLFASAHFYRLGFPLDDAWIHQTYARNLAEYGQWAFIPGQPSAGSTAPLWSVVLAAGYLLRLGPYLWTYLMGWAALASLAIAGMEVFRLLCPSRLRYAFWAGCFLVFEWHLVWAASSGMETLLIAFLALVCLGLLVSGKQNWLGIGLLIGASVWVRPDGLTLVGPALLVLLFSEVPWHTRLRHAALLGLGILLLVLPYLAFNRVLASAWMPNTFFAKQAEYAVQRQTPLWQRWMDQAALPLVGAGALLLPGFVLEIFFSSRSAFRRRQWGGLAGVAWFLGYLLLYALRLPATYQHGRYIMPAMPVYFMWSLAGMAAWIQPSAVQLWRRVLGRAWILATGLVLGSFWIIGARAYARDVAVIESEMVATARWVASNTEPGSLVAAHDIGALGYFGHRRLLDLAGLVSPEVIPFIRDETRLAAYLDSSQADFLVAFPGWYPNLAKRGHLIFTTGGVFSPAQGGENMSVYRWLPAP